MIGLGRPARAAVALCALLAGPLPGEPPPAVDLGLLFADDTAWRAGADHLEAAIAEVERRSSSEWTLPADLLAALRAKDEVHRLAAQVDGWLDLRAAFDHADPGVPALRPRMGEIARRWEESALPAFDARVAALSPARLAEWARAEPTLAPYLWQLGAAARAAPRPLSDRERELLAEVDAERRTARRIHAALAGPGAPEVGIDRRAGGTLRITPALARNLAAEIADPEDRRRALAAWREALGRQSAAYAALLAGVVGREAYDARVRGFASPLAAALGDEGVGEAIVDSELAAARAAGPAVGRIHRARQRLLGLARYGAADARVPLAGLRTDWTWSEARAALCAAAGSLGPEVGEVTARAFAEGWIDAADRPRKRPSGFSTYVYGEHPYASVVFRGTTPDLFRLAHEVGHAVHHFLAFRAQPYAVARPSILASEATAALFELALARELGAREGGPAAAAALADFEFQTAQRSFVATTLDADFERAAHAAGPDLDAGALGELYRERLTEFHGGALELEPSDDFAWIETPHFVTTPFYMPRYGLAFAAALALDERLRADDPTARAAAQSAIAELLRAGASAAPVELLARAGADLRSPALFAAVARHLEDLAARLEAAASAAAPSALPSPLRPASEAPRR